MAYQRYKPSEAVPVSGVYQVEHAGHRGNHDVTLLQGDTFPPCAVCNSNVSFTLKYRAGTLGDDKDFAADH